MTAQQGTSAHYTGDKATYVRDMFAGIAVRYDLLNDVLSFRRHHAWRRRAVKMSGLRPGDRALDVCTGTGDFALDLRRAVGDTGFVIGCDFCAPMVEVGQRKVAERGLTNVEMALSDAMRLPYRADSFDCVTVGFGIRNVTDAAKAIREMARVARPGGRVIILEFTQPNHPLWAPLANFYQLRILPIIGGFLSRKEAYTYLPRSIQAFHTRAELAAMMERAGLIDIRMQDLNFGTVCIHMGTKA